MANDISNRHRPPGLPSGMGEAIPSESEKKSPKKETRPETDAGASQQERHPDLPKHLDAGKQQTLSADRFREPPNKPKSYRHYNFHFSPLSAAFRDWLYDGIAASGKAQVDAQGNLSVAYRDFFKMIEGCKFNGVEINRKQLDDLVTTFRGSTITFNSKREITVGLNREKQRASAETLGRVGKFFEHVGLQYVVGETGAWDWVRNAVESNVLDTGTENERLEALLREIKTPEEMRAFKSAIEVSFQSEGRKLEEIVASETSGRLMARLSAIIRSIEAGDAHYLAQTYSAGSGRDQSMGDLFLSLRNVEQSAKEALSSPTTPPPPTPEQKAAAEKIEKLAQELKRTALDKLSNQTAYQTLGLSREQMEKLSPLALGALRGAMTSKTSFESAMAEGREMKKMEDEDWLMDLMMDDQELGYVKRAYEQFLGARGEFCRMARNSPEKIGLREIEALNRSMLELMRQVDIFRQQESGARDSMVARFEAAEMTTYVAIGALAAVFTGLGAVVALKALVGTAGLTALAGSGLVMGNSAITGLGIVLGTGAGTAAQTGALMIGDKVRGKDVGLHRTAKHIEDSRENAFTSALGVGIGGALGNAAKTGKLLSKAVPVLGDVHQTALAARTMLGARQLGQGLLQNGITRGAIVSMSIQATNTAIGEDASLWTTESLQSVLLSGAFGAVGGTVEGLLDKYEWAEKLWDPAQEVLESLGEEQFLRGDVSVESGIQAFGGAFSEMGGAKGAREISQSKEHNKGHTGTISATPSPEEKAARQARASLLDDGGKPAVPVSGWNPAGQRAEDVPLTDAERQALASTLGANPFMAAADRAANDPLHPAVFNPADPEPPARPEMRAGLSANPSVRQTSDTGNADGILAASRGKGGSGPSRSARNAIPRFKPSDLAEIASGAEISRDILDTLHQYRINGHSLLELCGTKQELIAALKSKSVAHVLWETAQAIQRKDQDHLEADAFLAQIMRPHLSVKLKVSSADDLTFSGFDDLKNAFPDSLSALDELADPRLFGRENLLEAATTDSAAFGQLLEAWKGNAELFRELAREDRLGIEPFRKLLRDSPANFTLALLNLAENAGTIRSLAEPDRLGPDTLRRIASSGILNLIAVAQQARESWAAFETLMRPGSLGPDIMRRKYADRPTAASHLLKTLSGAHLETFNRLSGPDSLGIELLRSLFDHPYTAHRRQLAGLVEAAHRCGETFWRMSAPDSIGIQSIRKAVAKNPDTAAISLIWISNNRELFARLLDETYLGNDTVRRCFENPTAFADMMKIVAENPDAFFASYRKLADHPGDGEALLRSAFAVAPQNMALALVRLDGYVEKLADYLSGSGNVDVNGLLLDFGREVHFTADSRSALSMANAGRNLARLLDIDPALVAANRDSDPLTVSFGDSPLAESESQGITLPLEPYKYSPDAPQTGTARKNDLRRAMGMADGRKILVASSPQAHTREPEALLEAYRKLPPENRPLLIIGMLEPREDLAREMEAAGFRVTVRSDASLPVSGFGQADVVMVNTRGEMAGFFAAGDAAVVGSNRNLLEPAAHGLPTLHFEGDPYESESWAYNRIAKDLLEDSGATRAIEDGKLHEQIQAVLDDPGTLAENVPDALGRFYGDIIPAARLAASLLISGHVLSGAAEPDFKPHGPNRISSSSVLLNRLIDAFNRDGKAESLQRILDLPSTEGQEIEPSAIDHLNYSALHGDAKLVARQIRFLFEKYGQCDPAVVDRYLAGMADGRIPKARFLHSIHQKNDSMVSAVLQRIIDDRSLEALKSLIACAKNSEAKTGPKSGFHGLLAEIGETMLAQAGEPGVRDFLTLTAEFSDKVRLAIAPRVPAGLLPPVNQPNGIGTFLSRIRLGKQMREDPELTELLDQSHRFPITVVMKDGNAALDTAGASYNPKDGVIEVSKAAVQDADAIQAALKKILLAHYRFVQEPELAESEIESENASPHSRAFAEAAGIRPIGSLKELTRRTVTEKTGTVLSRIPAFEVPLELDKGPGTELLGFMERDGVAYLRQAVGGRCPWIAAVNAYQASRGGALSKTDLVNAYRALMKKSVGALLPGYDPLEVGRVYSKHEGKNALHKMIRTHRDADDRKLVQDALDAGKLVLFFEGGGTRVLMRSPAGNPSVLNFWDVSQSREVTYDELGAMTMNFIIISPETVERMAGLTPEAAKAANVRKEAGLLEPNSDPAIVTPDAAREPADPDVRRLLEQKESEKAKAKVQSPEKPAQPVSDVSGSPPRQERPDGFLPLSFDQADGTTDNRSVILGRDQSLGILVNDSQARKKHAAIILNPQTGAYSIRNLTSDRDTLVIRGGECVRLSGKSGRELAPGDQIIIGRVRYVFVLDESGPRTGGREGVGLIQAEYGKAGPDWIPPPAIRGLKALHPKITAESAPDGCWVRRKFDDGEPVWIRRQGKWVARYEAFKLEDGDVVAAEKDAPSQFAFRFDSGREPRFDLMGAAPSPDIKPFAPKWPPREAGRARPDGLKLFEKLEAMPRHEVGDALYEAYKHGDLVSWVLALEEGFLPAANPHNFTAANERLVEIEDRFSSEYVPPEYASKDQMSEAIIEYLFANGGRPDAESFNGQLYRKAQGDPSLFRTLYKLAQLARFMNRVLNVRFESSDVSMANLLLTGEGICENKTLLFVHFARLINLQVGVTVSISRRHTNPLLLGPGIVIETTDNFRLHPPTPPVPGDTGTSQDPVPAELAFVSRLANLLNQVRDHGLSLRMFNLTEKMLSNHIKVDAPAIPGEAAIPSTRATPSENMHPQVAHEEAARYWQTVDAQLERLTPSDRLRILKSVRPGLDFTRPAAPDADPAVAALADPLKFWGPEFAGSVAGALFETAVSRWSALLLKTQRDRWLELHPGKTHLDALGIQDPEAQIVTLYAVGNPLTGARCSAILPELLKATEGNQPVWAIDVPIASLKRAHPRDAASRHSGFSVSTPHDRARFLPVEGIRDNPTAYGLRVIGRKSADGSVRFEGEYGQPVTVYGDMLPPGARHTEYLEASEHAQDGGKLPERNRRRLTIPSGSILRFSPDSDESTAHREFTARYGATDAPDGSFDAETSGRPTDNVSYPVYRQDNRAVEARLRRADPDKPVSPSFRRYRVTATGEGRITLQDAQNPQTSVTFVFDSEDPASIPVLAAGDPVDLLYNPAGGSGDRTPPASPVPIEEIRDPQALVAIFNSRGIELDAALADDLFRLVNESKGHESFRSKPDPFKAILAHQINNLKSIFTMIVDERIPSDVLETRALQEASYRRLVPLCAFAGMQLPTSFTPLPPAVGSKFAESLVALQEGGLREFDPAHYRSAKKYLEAVRAGGDSEGETEFLLAVPGYALPVPEGTIFFLTPDRRYSDQWEAYTVTRVTRAKITVQNQKTGQTSTLSLPAGRTHPFSKGSEVTFRPAEAGENEVMDLPLTRDPSERAATPVEATLDLEALKRPEPEQTRVEGARRRKARGQTPTPTIVATPVYQGPDRRSQAPRLSVHHSLTADLAPRLEAVQKGLIHDPRKLPAEVLLSFSQDLHHPSGDIQPVLDPSETLKRVETRLDRTLARGRNIVMLRSADGWDDIPFEILPPRAGKGEPAHPNRLINSRGAIGHPWQMRVACVNGPDGGKKFWLTAGDAESAGKISVRAAGRDVPVDGNGVLIDANADYTLFIAGMEWKWHKPSEANSDPQPPYLVRTQLAGLETALLYYNSPEFSSARAELERRGGTLAREAAAFQKLHDELDETLGRYYAAEDLSQLSDDAVRRGLPGLAKDAGLPAPDLSNPPVAARRAMHALWHRALAILRRMGESDYDRTVDAFHEAAAREESRIEAVKKSLIRLQMPDENLKPSDFRCSLERRNLDDPALNRHLSMRFDTADSLNLLVAIGYVRDAAFVPALVSRLTDMGFTVQPVPANQEEAQTDYGVAPIARYRIELDGQRVILELNQAVPDPTERLRSALSRHARTFGEMADRLRGLRRDRNWTATLVGALAGSSADLMRVRDELDRSNPQEARVIGGIATELGDIIAQAGQAGLDGLNPTRADVSAALESMVKLARQLELGDTADNLNRSLEAVRGNWKRLLLNSVEERIRAALYNPDLAEVTLGSLTLPILTACQESLSPDAVLFIRNAVETLQPASAGVVPFYFNLLRAKRIPTEAFLEDGQFFSWLRELAAKDLRTMAAIRSCMNLPDADPRLNSAIRAFIEGRDPMPANGSKTPPKGTRVVRLEVKKPAEAASNPGLQDPAPLTALNDEFAGCTTAKQATAFFASRGITIDARTAGHILKGFALYGGNFEKYWSNLVSDFHPPYPNRETDLQGSDLREIAWFTILYRADQENKYPQLAALKPLLGKTREIPPFTVVHPEQIPASSIAGPQYKKLLGEMAVRLEAVGKALASAEKAGLKLSESESSSLDAYLASVKRNEPTPEDLSFLAALHRYSYPLGASGEAGSLHLQSGGKRKDYVITSLTATSMKLKDVKTGKAISCKINPWMAHPFQVGDEVSYAPPTDKGPPNGPGLGGASAIIAGASALLAPGTSWAQAVEALPAPVGAPEDMASGMLFVGALALTGVLFLAAAGKRFVEAYRRREAEKTHPRIDTVAEAKTWRGGPMPLWKQSLLLPLVPAGVLDIGGIPPRGGSKARANSGADFIARSNAAQLSGLDFRGAAINFPRSNASHARKCSEQIITATLLLDRKGSLARVIDADGRHLESNPPTTAAPDELVKIPVILDSRSRQLVWYSPDNAPSGHPCRGVLEKMHGSSGKARFEALITGSPVEMISALPEAAVIGLEAALPKDSLLIKDLDDILGAFNGNDGTQLTVYVYLDEQNRFRASVKPRVHSHAVSLSIEKPLPFAPPRQVSVLPGRAAPLVQTPFREALGVLEGQFAVIYANFKKSVAGSADATDWSTEPVGDFTAGPTEEGHLNDVTTDALLDGTETASVDEKTDRPLTEDDATAPAPQPLEAVFSPVELNYNPKRNKACRLPEGQSQDLGAMLFGGKEAGIHLTVNEDGKPVIRDNRRNRQTSPLRVNGAELPWGTARVLSSGDLLALGENSPSYQYRAPAESALRKSMERMPESERETVARKLAGTAKLAGYAAILRAYLTADRFAEVEAEINAVLEEGRSIASLDDDLSRRVGAEMDERIKQAREEGFSETAYSAATNPVWTAVEMYYHSSRRFLELKDKIRAIHPTGRVDSDLAKIRYAVLDSGLEWIDGKSAAEIANALTAGDVGKLPRAMDIRQKARDILDNRVDQTQVHAPRTHSSVRRAAAQIEADYKANVVAAASDYHDDKYSPEQMTELVYQVLQRGKPLAMLPRGGTSRPAGLIRGLFRKTTKNPNVRQMAQEHMSRVIHEAEKLFGAQMAQEHNPLTGERVHPNNLEERYRLAKALLNREIGLPPNGLPSQAEDAALRETLGQYLEIDAEILSYAELQQALRKEMNGLTPDFRVMFEKSSPDMRALLIETYFGSSRHRDLPKGPRAFEIAHFIGKTGFYRELGETYEFVNGEIRVSLSLGDLDSVSPEQGNRMFGIHTHPAEFLDEEGNVMGSEDENKEYHTMALGKEAKLSPDNRNILFSETDIKIWLSNAQFYCQHYAKRYGTTPIYDAQNNIYRNRGTKDYGAPIIHIQMDARGRVKDVTIFYAFWEKDFERNDAYLKQIEKHKQRAKDGKYPGINEITFKQITPQEWERMNREAYRGFGE